MAKKDFTTIAAGEENTVNSAIADATAPEKEPQKRKPKQNVDPERARQAREERKTSGIKGAKMHRINMGFTDANYDYLYVMSRVSGQNVSEFVNRIIAADRLENLELYTEALRFKAKLND